MSQPNPQESPEQTAAEETNRRAWTVIPPWVMLTLALLAIAAYWILPHLVSSFSLKAGILLYLGHWAAVGGLIGFALSKGDRGAALGGILGALIAALLMC